MKKAGITLLIISLVSIFYFLILPVENGKFVGEWYAMGDSESANTKWDIYRFNVINPDVYWTDESEYGWRFYHLTKEDSVFISKDLMSTFRGIDFSGFLKNNSKDTLEIYVNSGNRIPPNDLTLVRLNSPTKIVNDIIINNDYFTNGYWRFERDSLFLEFYFYQDHLFDDLNAPQIVKVRGLRTLTFEEPYDGWDFKEFNGKYILSVYFRSYGSTLNILFNEVNHDAIKATSFWDTHENEASLTRLKTDESENNRVVSILTSKKWTTRSAEQLPQWGGSSGRSFDHYSLTRDDIKNGLLSFSFNEDSTFQIFNSDSLIIESDWWLSNNPNLIFTDNRENEFIKIINRLDDQLTLEMHIMVWGDQDMLIDTKPESEEVMMYGDTFHQLRYRFILE